MPLSTPDFASIRDTLLRDLQNLRADADIAPDSDYFVRASSVASAVEGLYQHQSWIARQIFPDTADSEYLEQHARLRGIVRKPAAAASGTLRISGNAGAVVSGSLQLRIGEQLYATPPPIRTAAPTPPGWTPTARPSCPSSPARPAPPAISRRACRWN
ncbi:Uncharacterized homolog of phage Mu protein gp47 [Chromobacterium violaceum]|uniref:Uncharacterized homolog of phage Mu protein gp47 n=1 Tax=Chromobacterium violaceum TaxID=536 RepID=A0A3S4HM74_CHRVL|nr:Uncharacterized homolog of phage Mu protein gp47 [Chromobacterium violaceum]